jgi:hypothetical protein
MLCPCPQISLKSPEFDPELSLGEKQEMVESLYSIANELWPAKKNQFQQVTSEISAVSDLALSGLNPPNFKDVPSSILTIVTLPSEFIRKYLRRRKVGAMLRTKQAFLNSRPTVDTISNIFGCSACLITRTELEMRALRSAHVSAGVRI